MSHIFDIFDQCELNLCASFSFLLQKMSFHMSHTFDLFFQHELRTDFMWFLKLPASENDFPHMSQLWFLWLLWPALTCFFDFLAFHMCLVKSFALEKVLPHESHLCFFRPLWTESKCCFKLPAWANNLLHDWHL